MRGINIFFTSSYHIKETFLSQINLKSAEIFRQLVYCIVLLPTTTGTKSECNAYLLSLSQNAHHLLVQVNTFLQYFVSASQVQIPYW